MMQELEIKNVDCHATLAMIEKRWGFPRRTLRALLGMTKSGQSGRSLLPESGADAPAVLSAVYPDSTPAKNRQADVPQYGRSMIEMLGVLAIIGVLSVGGIAGYSKAMQKYRINKAIEQITLIVGNIRTFFAPQNSYEGLNTYTDIGKSIIKKAKLVPDEMLEYNSDGTIKRITNAFGGDVEFIENYEPKSLRIIFDGVSESECIELLMHDWSNLSAPSHTSFIFTMKEEHYLCWAKYPVGLDDATKICGFVESFGITVDADINGESLSEDLYHGDCLGYIE